MSKNRHKMSSRAIFPPWAFAIVGSVHLMEGERNEKNSNTVLKQNMKNSYKAALLAVLGLMAATSSQALTTDLSLGFNDLAGPSSAQNDYVIDIGSYANFTTTATLNLSGDLNASTFSQAYIQTSGGSTLDANWMNDVAVGVVGANNPVSSRSLYSTFLTPPSGTITGGNEKSSINQAVSIAPGEYSSSSGLGAQNGWSFFVAPSPTLAQTAGQTETTIAQYLGQNPEQLLSSGIITENLYENTQANQVANGSAFTELGTFNINLNTDTITFTGIDAAPVPEPASYGLVGGFGLLLVCLRRQFVKKNA